MTTQPMPEDLERDFANLIWAREFAAACAAPWSEDAARRVGIKIGQTTKKIFDAEQEMQARMDRADENEMRRVQIAAAEPGDAWEPPIEESRIVQPTATETWNYGVHSSIAHWWMYMLYDSYFGNPKIWLFTRERAAQLANEWVKSGKELKDGRRFGCGPEFTGKGILANRFQLDARVYDFVPNPKFAYLSKLGKNGISRTGKRGELDAGDFLRPRGKTEYMTEKTEQMKGYDYWWTENLTNERLPLEVKSREPYQEYENIFIQVWEKGQGLSA